MRDIGTGGFDGFSEFDARAIEWNYFPGGHGAPLSDDRLENVVEFVVTGQAQEPPDLIDSPPSWLRPASRIAPVAFPLLLLLIIALLAWAWFNQGLLLFAIILAVLVVSVALLMLL